MTFTKSSGAPEKTFTAPREFGESTDKIFVVNVIKGNPPRVERRAGALGRPPRGVRGRKGLSGRIDPLDSF
jgi:hypothetical protein